MLCTGGTRGDGQTRNGVGCRVPPDVSIGDHQKYVVADKTPLPAAVSVPHSFSLSVAVRNLRQVQHSVSS